jgi:hypothetical protein
MARDALFFFCGGGFFAVGLFLALYLDLRIHALRQSGDLPESTRQLFGWSGPLGGGGIGVDVVYLYGEQFRRIDKHTRRLAPIIRIALPLGIAFVLMSLLI